MVAADGGGTETLLHGVLENAAQVAEEYDLPEFVAGNTRCPELAVPLAALGRREKVAAAVAAAEGSLALVAVVAESAGPFPASTTTSEGCHDSDSSCAWPQSPPAAKAAAVDWSSGSARME